MKQEDVDAWVRAVRRFREEKDGYFKESHDAPIPREDRPSFPGLKYFDPDPALRYEVKLQRYPNPDSVVMATSKGTRQLFNRVGHFDIVVGENKVSLQAYQSAERDDPHLFVPFRDSTSGKETYGAARYLDLDVEHDDDYAVDFNYAYNPYCAYSEDYICPLPPNENWLSVPIRAGEKKYHE